MNPLNYDTKELDENYLSFEKMYPKAYDKLKTSPYTKTRVILMNGTEFESVWFMHQFARNCNEPEILESLARIRRQEQMQQKRISSLKPKNESILETTIAYEQLAVDLTATLAVNEKDATNKKALNFALLEDFDHLYRYSNLLKMDKNIDAKMLVGEYTEIMPGRPTIVEHRYPSDDLKPHINAKKADIFSKLVGCIITAAEQQTMNYYMNIAQWYKNDLGRKLYSEIALIEEAHVTQYESLNDPTMSFLEKWVFHEFTECYLYYSAYEDETDKNIKQIWLEHYQMECGHLKEAIRLLEKYEKKKYNTVIGMGDFPALLKIGSYKDYIREVLETTVSLNAKNMDYIEIEKLKPDDKYFYYQKKIVGENPSVVASVQVIKKAKNKLGKDYKYQDKKIKIDENEVLNKFGYKKI